MPKRKTENESSAESIIRPTEASMLLPVPIEMEKIAEGGHEMASIIERIDDLKNELKKYKAKINSEIEPLESRQKELQKSLRTKSIMQMVKCRIEYHWTENEKRIYRVDTNELIQTEIIAAVDRQEELNIPENSEVNISNKSESNLRENKESDQSKIDGKQKANVKASLKIEEIFDINSNNTIAQKANVETFGPAFVMTNTDPNATYQKMEKGKEIWLGFDELKTSDVITATMTNNNKLKFLVEKGATKNSDGLLEIIAKQIK